VVTGYNLSFIADGDVVRSVMVNAAPTSPMVASRQTILGIKSSSNDCKTLGWSFYGSVNVCAASKVDENACSGITSLEVAKDICAARGARLCSSEELTEDAAAGSGCGYDTSRVWSSTKCEQGGIAGFYTQSGSRKGLRDIPKQCSKKHTKAFVRCCASQPNLPVWTDHTPSQICALPFEFQGEKKFECFPPDGDKVKEWCYTDTKGNWGYCKIDKKPECKLVQYANGDFTGVNSTTPEGSFTSVT
jgi:hypothetical protein